jgi:hypothetical protein
MRFTITHTHTIDIPEDQVAGLVHLIARHLAESVHPAAPPGDPIRPDRPAHPPDGPPTDGRTLLGWADRHDLRSAVLKLGRSRRYPSKVLEWTEDQVADVYHELAAKPPKGSQAWGVARSGHVIPK